MDAISNYLRNLGANVRCELADAKNVCGRGRTLAYTVAALSIAAAIAVPSLKYTSNRVALNYSVPIYRDVNDDGIVDRVVQTPRGVFGDLETEVQYGFRLGRTKEPVYISENMLARKVNQR